MFVPHENLFWKKTLPYFREDHVDFADYNYFVIIVHDLLLSVKELRNDSY